MTRVSALESNVSSLKNQKAFSHSQGSTSSTVINQSKTSMLYIFGHALSGYVKIESGGMGYTTEEVLTSYGFFQVCISYYGVASKQICHGVYVDSSGAVKALNVQVNFATAFSITSNQVYDIFYYNS